MSDIFEVRGRLEVSPAAVYREPAAALADLTARGGLGWICFTDRVETWRGGKLTGLPLSAEVVLPSGTESLHLRAVGASWELRTLREHTEGDDGRVTHSYVANEHPAVGADRLRYHVWWRGFDKDGIRVWRPFAARFTGFDGAR